MTRHSMLLLDTSTFEAFHYLASCECRGWTGQEHDAKDEAIAEWEQHSENANRENRTWIILRC